MVNLSIFFVFPVELHILQKCESYDSLFFVVVRKLSDENPLGNQRGNHSVTIAVPGDSQLQLALSRRKGLC